MAKLLAQAGADTPGTTVEPFRESLVEVLEWFGVASADDLIDLALPFLVVEVVDLTFAGVGVPAIAGTVQWMTLTSHR
jgi:hypothetical protein